MKKDTKTEYSLGAISPLFHNICFLLLGFHDKTVTRFPL